MDIDEKSLFVKSFDVVYILELIENGLDFFWNDLEAMRGNSIEFQKFYKICVQWPSIVQCPILNPMIIFKFKKSVFDVDVIYVHFSCVNYLFLDFNELMMIWKVIEMMLFYD